MWHRVTVRLDLLEQAERLQVSDDTLARLEPIETTVGLGNVVVEPGVGIENVDHLEVLALADLEIVEVVGRRHLHGARALFGIGVGIGDDRDPAPDQR